MILKASIACPVHVQYNSKDSHDQSVIIGISVSKYWVRVIRLHTSSLITNRFGPMAATMERTYIARISKVLRTLNSLYNVEQYGDDLGYLMPFYSIHQIIVLVYIQFRDVPEMISNSRNTSNHLSLEVYLWTKPGCIRKEQGITLLLYVPAIM